MLKVIYRDFCVKKSRKIEQRKTMFEVTYPHTEIFVQSKSRNLESRKTVLEVTYPHTERVGGGQTGCSL